MLISDKWHGQGLGKELLARLMIVGAGETSSVQFNAAPTPPVPATPVTVTDMTTTTSVSGGAGGAAGGLGVAGATAVGVGAAVAVTVAAIVIRAASKKWPERVTHYAIVCSDLNDARLLPRTEVCFKKISQGA